MSLQQVVAPRSSSNGFGRRRVEREMGTRLDSKPQSGKPNTISFTNAGALNGGEVGGSESLSRDRLIYLTTCLIGHRVEVQVKNGTIFSGIFHATGAEKDFGVILKMARLIKDGSFRGQKSLFDSTSKPPSKTLIIPAKELVQIIAKGVPLSGDGLANGLQLEKRQDIMIDTLISQSHYVEVERELERWTPDEDDPQLPELENIFDGTWNRNWDQFETNEALFGVKSTFDEELYTTKLEKGPQMRDLEKEASRIAREIEGEETQDLHLAEERGFSFHEDFDIDEETRFSSVFRGLDDSGYEESEEMTFGSRNTEGFGGSSGSVISRSFSDVARGKSNDGAQVSSSSSSMDDTQSSQSNASKDLYRSSSSDHTKQLTSDSVSKSLSALNGESRLSENQFRERHGGKGYPTESAEWKTLLVGEEAHTSKSEDLQSSVNMKKAVSDKGGLSSSATAFAPSSVSSKGHENTILGESSDSTGSGKLSGATQAVNSRGRPGSSTSSTSECVGAPSASAGLGLSPSSSMGSLSSEKSSLNPNAKEFKLNPNAKSFTPSQTTLRPPSPVSEGSFYFPANMSAVPHMHGVPVGIGIAPSFGHQPVIYNPQATPMQAPQAYVQPNGPLYGQQMILGHPRQVLYMPNYPPEMPYKGREF
ncbi:polyadenylate-binding protein-interacting protein 4-like [Telopea speciosissima]|uniref:polyadenylate-binding protein-interacting protein 4-like n=1 Tax=Telopea speciosissima TaxID=54955 RepID=UPI001CC50117|nr:polyadenylate-binding protein-interacting protein 4-like [Telopea speciosissima]